MDKPFNEIMIKLTLGCGFIHKREDEELLSDYWSEEDWDDLSAIKKEQWLNEFWMDWKCNYESGGVWLE